MADLSTQLSSSEISKSSHELCRTCCRRDAEGGACGLGASFLGSQSGRSGAALAGAPCQTRSDRTDRQHCARADRLARHILDSLQREIQREYRRCARLRSVFGVRRMRPILHRACAGMGMDVSARQVGVGRLSRALRHAPLRRADDLRFGLLQRSIARMM
jgi:hypothetical protein